MLVWEQGESKDPAPWKIDSLNNRARSLKPTVALIRSRNTGRATSGSLFNQGLWFHLALIFLSLVYIK